MTSAEMARLGRPFARRHGAPLLDASTINVQTGVFRSSWMVRTAPIARYTVVVHNSASYADHLEKGTRYAFARPLSDKLREYADAALPTEVQLALRRVEDSHRP